MKVTNLEEMKRFGRRVRNWGRWGSNDEAGTLNFLTPERIVKATKLVKKGKVFALAISLRGKCGMATIALW